MRLIDNDIVESPQIEIIKMPANRRAHREQAGGILGVRVGWIIQAIRVIVSQKAGIAFHGCR